MRDPYIGVLTAPELVTFDEMRFQYQGDHDTETITFVSTTAYPSSTFSGGISTIFATNASGLVYQISYLGNVSAQAAYNALASGGEQGLFQAVSTGFTGIGTSPGASVGADTLVGGPAGNVIEPASGADSIVGGNGNDSISGSISGGSISGETVLGMAGNDTIVGSPGGDLLNGNMGDDLIAGASGGGDTLYGGQGNDTIYAYESRALETNLSAQYGNEVINGNMGDDVIYGGRGSSTPNTLQGNDTQQGFVDLGNDTLHGGQGNDTIYAGSGNQTISGDLGNDILYAGSGHDNFVFAPGAGADWIANWNGAQDHIVLPTGTAYTVESYQGQVMIAYGDGDTIGLAGAPVSAFSSTWIIFS